jgi:hypothetical protein
MRDLVICTRGSRRHIDIKLCQWERLAEDASVIAATIELSVTATALPSHLDERD